MYAPAELTSRSTLTREAQKGIVIPEKLWAAIHNTLADGQQRVVHDGGEFFIVLRTHPPGCPPQESGEPVCVFLVTGYTSYRIPKLTEAANVECARV